MHKYFVNVIIKMNNIVQGGYVMSQYNYTPEQEQAIQNLIKKYEPCKETPLEQAQRLDRLAKNRIFTVTLLFVLTALNITTIGIYGGLLWHPKLFPFSCTICAFGLSLCCLVPSVHRKITKSEHDKIANTIITILQK